MRIGIPKRSGLIASTGNRATTRAIRRCAQSSENAGYDEDSSRSICSAQSSAEARSSESKVAESGFSLSRSSDNGYRNWQCSAFYQRHSCWATIRFYRCSLGRWFHWWNQPVGPMLAIPWSSGRALDSDQSYYASIRCYHFQSKSSAAPRSISSIRSG